MNLTNQHIINPKSKIICADQKIKSCIVPKTSNKLRIDTSRDVLNGIDKKMNFKIKGIDFNMILCRPGFLRMGIEGNKTNPLKTAEITDSYLLGETEVTQGLYKAVMGFNPSKFSQEWYDHLRNRSEEDKKTLKERSFFNNPVENLTWWDAVLFCNKLSDLTQRIQYYNVSDIVFDSSNERVMSAEVSINPNSDGFRLPTEKEWEYAAKAGTDNKWAGCDEGEYVQEYAWFGDNSSGCTNQVKTKNANEWGFYDMSGNINEMCYDLRKKGSSVRVYRGGDWSNNEIKSFQLGERMGMEEDYYSKSIGFRIASTLFEDEKDKK